MPIKPIGLTEPISEILDIAIEINCADTVADIVRTVMAMVARLIPYDRASICLVDPTSRVLEVSNLELSPEADPADGESGLIIPIEDTNVLGWVVLNQRHHLRRSLAEAYPFDSVQVTRPAPSHIIAPLLGREDVLGVLTIGSYSEHAFDEGSAEVFCRYAHLIAVAIENLRRYEHHKELSIKDGLTGAYNHRHFQEVLGEELERARRYHTSLSLLMVDIDFFKNFNDRFGHLAGDRILKQFVTLMAGSLRSSDTLFRYGGEEFAILLVSTSREEAVSVADKLLQRILRDSIYRPSASTAVSVTACIGLATFPADAFDPQGLIAAADQALYGAKDRGRNTCVSFKELEGELALEARIKELVAKATTTQVSSYEPHVGHSHRVLEWANLLAEHLKLDAQQQIHLRVAASCHDIGQLCIPRELFASPRSLTARERKVVQTHSAVSASLLRKHVQIPEVLDAVLHHHERFNGSGYPAGLAGKAIPRFARILAVADTFDALISVRPYREKPCSPEEALQVLLDVAGYQLDPDLVTRFVDAYRKRTQEQPDRAEV